MPVTYGRSRTARYGNFPHLGASGCHLYRRSLVPCSPALALISARAEGVSTLVPPMLYAMYAYYVTCSRTSVLFTGIINTALALISARAEGSHFCALYRSSVCVCLHSFRFRLHHNAQEGVDCGMHRLAMYLHRNDFQSVHAKALRRRRT